MRAPLTVTVDKELVLDAGSCERVLGPDGPWLLLHPPGTTLFHQVLAYLREKPDPVEEPRGSTSDREGIAAAAVTLRWGSYLAVLLDSAKPIWSEVKSPATSRISDEEMARINIEASAAVAEWVDLCRTDRNRRLYFKLVDRAVSYLPMTKRKSKLRFSEFMALADPEIATRLIEDCDGVTLERVYAEAEHLASRLFGNALTNHAWRNGPVEDIHAGSSRGYPLDQRRMSLQEERELMSFASARLALGMQVCRRFSSQEAAHPWSEQVVPYGLAAGLLITPSRWSLTESSREVHLPVAT